MHKRHLLDPRGSRREARKTKTAKVHKAARATRNPQMTTGDEQSNRAKGESDPSLWKSTRH